MLQTDPLPEQGVRAVYAAKSGAMASVFIVAWLVKLFIFPDIPAAQYSLLILVVLPTTLAVALWRGAVPVWLLASSFVVDVAAVTAGIHFGGGVDNVGGPLLYAALIGLAGVVISERAAYLTAGGSGLLYALTAWAEYQQWLPHQLPYTKPPDDALATVVILNAYLLLAAWVVSFAARQIRTIYRHAEQVRIETVSALSHDLKNPLGVIHAYTQLVEDADPAERQEYLQRIQQATQQSLDLVHNILDEAAIAGRPLVPDFQPVSLNRLVTQASQVYGTTAAVKGVRLSTLLAPALPLIHGDPRLLQRALHNLVSNAIKFTDDGGSVEIATSTNGDLVQLTVGDTGRGIPAGEQSRLFQQYSRTTASRTIEGTGLGLYIVRKMAEAHGGSVSVTSEVGSGSTFTLSLPVAGKSTPDDDAR